MTGRDRIAILGGIALAVACAAQQKPAAMTQYEEARAAESARIVEQRFPDLYNEAQVHHAKATQAFKDKEDALVEHHAKVALLWWEAARTNSEMVDLQQQKEETEAALATAESELAEAEKRKKDAESAVARLERIIALEGKLGDSEGMNEARNAMNQALAAMKAAEAVNAGAYAAKEFGEAEAKFKAATDALEKGKAKDAKSFALEAKVAAEAAEKAAKPQYEKDKAELAYEARRRALFDATASVPGVQRAITEGGVLVTVREVFPSGKVEIDPVHYETFNRLAKIAIEYKDFSLVIEGHTDSKGSDAKNLALSEGRAKSIGSYLAEKGVSPSRITSLGKGSAEPVAENTSKAGRAQNRRIEILFAQGAPP